MRHEELEKSVGSIRKETSSAVFASHVLALGRPVPGGVCQGRLTIDDNGGQSWNQMVLYHGTDQEDAK